MACIRIKNLENIIQSSPWRHVLGLLLIIVLTNGVLILSQINSDQTFRLDNIILYTGVIAPSGLAALLIIIRFFYCERIGDLNLKKGTWWQDVPGGFVLTFLTLGSLFLFGPIIERVLPRAAGSDLGDMFKGLTQNPWLLVLYVGPLLAIGVAGFEEVIRIFFLTRWWKIKPGATWRWLGVLISAVLFGLAHYYQGPSGMANAAIGGLILAAVYLRFGRVWPLIISHYLHDAIQILLFVYLMRLNAI